MQAGDPQHCRDRARTPCLGCTPAGTAAARGMETARIPEEQTSTIQAWSVILLAVPGAWAESGGSQRCRTRAGSWRPGRASAPVPPLSPRSPAAPLPPRAGSSCSAPPRAAPPSTSDLRRQREFLRARSLGLLPPCPSAPRHPAPEANLLWGSSGAARSIPRDVPSPQHRAHLPADPKGCSEPMAPHSPLRSRPTVWEKP